MFLSIYRALLSIKPYMTQNSAVFIALMYIRKLFMVLDIQLFNIDVPMSYKETVRVVGHGPTFVA